MRFKKLMALFTALALVMTPVTAVFAQDGQAETAVSVTYDKKLDLLGALGIIDVKNVDLGAEISRSSFCKAAYALYGMSEADYDGASAFTDITGDTVGYGAINYLSAVGVINVPSDGAFNPDRAISGYEAVKIVTEILGLGKMAQYYGGWTNGYITAANRYKLLSGIKTGYANALTNLDAANLLYNSLFAILPEVDGIEASYGKDTLLTKNFDVYNTDGKITANDCFAIGGGSVAADGEVIIDGKKYKTGETDIADYVGYSADVYYKDNARSNTAEIVWFDVESESDVLVIDAEDIISFKNNEYSYTTGNSNTIKKEKIAASADIIYNKSAVSYNEKYMLPAKGTVTLIDTDGNGKYDVVNIIAYKNIVVEGVYVEDKIIAGKYDSEPIDLGGNDTVIDIKDIYGTSFELENLFEWDVLTYIESVGNGKKRFEAVLVRDYIAGTIESAGGTDDRDVVINGKKAKISENYPMTDKYKLQTGYTGDFLLDRFGEIAAYVIAPENSWQFGYYIKTTDKNGLSGGKAVIFAEKAKKVDEYEFAKNVTLDGTGVSGTSQVLADLGANGGQLIRFVLNREGKIVNIDTTSPDDGGSINDTLVRYVDTVPSGSERRYNNNTTIGFSLAVGSKTRVFIVPTEANRYEYDMYALKDQSFFKQFSSMYSFNAIEAYRTTEDTLIADAVVYYFDYADGMPRQIQNNVAVVKNITNSVMPDGEKAQKLTLLERGNTLELFTDADYGLEIGDGIQYGKDYKGRVSDVRKIWDYTTDIDSIRLCDDIPSYQIGTSYDSTFRIQIGYVYASKGGIVAICKDKPTGTLTDDMLEMHAISAFKFEVVDSTGKEVTVRFGTADDLLDWKSYGDGCSKIAIFTKNSDSRNITIFK